MKMTLLDMTQSILAAMGSDQVNSIGDTVESTQVAEILRQTYYNMLGRYDLPEHNQFVYLISSTNPAQPTLMTMPDGISRIESIDYFDTNPSDSQQVDQFGSFSHGLNVDISSSSTPAWISTSTTTNTIATGSQTFTITAGLNNTSTVVSTGQSVFIYSGSPPAGANSMTGTVTSYNNGTGQLVVQVTVINGGGTFSQWTLSNNVQSVFGPGYKPVRMLPIDDFFHLIDRYDPSETNTGSYSLAVVDDATGVSNNFTIYYKNNIQPAYCTILSNQFVIFDSYDATQDSVLQSSKSRAYAWSIPSWTMSDTFIPNINEQHFPLMLNDAKSLAFTEIKQMPHQKAEDEVARQLVSLQKWKAISGKPSYFDELPSFGRRGPMGFSWQREMDRR
jgi:hypothetical protein